MIVALEVRHIEDLRCRLLEQRSAPQAAYYYEVRHDRDRKFTAIKYLGRNHDHCERMFHRYTDNLEAANAADRARQ